MEDLKKLLAAATPGPWTHASDKLAAGNIKAPDNAALICAAVNALPELLAMAEENARLREALQAIADRHIPDQPPAYDVSEADYARKHYMELRMLARAALKELGQ